MEARHGIERSATRRACAQVIPGGRAQQRLTNLLGSRLLPPPIRAIEHGKGGAILGAERNRSLLGALALEPFGEVRCWGQRDERRQARKFTADLFDHLLDQKMAK